MKNTQLPPETKSSSVKDSPSRTIHIWILAALAANALLLAVIALQIKQVGNQLTYMAEQDLPHTTGEYVCAETPPSNLPYQVSFAKYDGYSAYRASSSDPIPVRIVGTPLPVTIDDSKVNVVVENSSWDPVPVTMKN